MTREAAPEFGTRDGSGLTGGGFSQWLRAFRRTPRTEARHAPQHPVGARRAEGGTPPQSAFGASQESRATERRADGVQAARGSGATAGPAPRTRKPPGERAAAWAELLRLPALFSVPGDALCGAATAAVAPNRGTALAAGTSLGLYTAGMALNDWADREIDALERPSRPLPSGRIRPASALTAAGALTVAGLATAASAGRPALITAVALTGTVWAYDLCLKQTAAGPAAMAAARSLDLLLGAVASGHAARGRGALAAGPVRESAGALPRPPAPAWRSAAILGSHTLATTLLSRREAFGGSTSAPLAALATTATVSAVLGRGDALRGGRMGNERGAGHRARSAVPLTRTAPLSHQATRALMAGAVLLYASTAGRPGVQAALNPSPQLTQQAVGGGIRAMIPLQAALALRHGGRSSALLLLGLAPLARRLARRFSAT
ncbi:SCO3242 family prenyltransferase [Streptomyces sp. NPDC051776]|uniref:SCO3242 family prenyltransferase n=1 Tax=Streptomyces sp. NPDC051776 TaxID=3155414 RepID=UPI00341F7B89